MELDAATRVVKRGGRVLQLSPREYSLVLLSLATALLAAGFAIGEAVDREIRSELDSLLQSEALALAGAAHWEDGAFNVHFDDATLRPFLAPRSGAYFEIRTSGEVAARSRSLDGTTLTPWKNRRAISNR